MGIALGNLAVLILDTLRDVTAAACEGAGIPATYFSLPLAYVLLSLFIWLAGSLALALFSGRLLGTLVWLTLAGAALLVGFSPWLTPSFLDTVTIPDGDTPQAIVGSGLIVITSLSMIVTAAWADSRRRRWTLGWFLLWLTICGALTLFAFDSIRNLPSPTAALGIVAAVVSPLIAVGLPRKKRGIDAPALPAAAPAKKKRWWGKRVRQPAATPALLPAPVHQSQALPNYPQYQQYLAPQYVPQPMSQPLKPATYPTPTTRIDPVVTMPTASRATTYVVTLPNSTTCWSDLAPAITPLATHEPREIDRYRLQGRLGSGGMAIVYLGQDTQTGERVAVKVANPMATIDVQVQERMMHEIMALTAVTSPYIVRVRRTGMSGSYPFIAMDYLKGPSLAAANALRGPVTNIADLNRLALGTASGLAAIHQSGYIHRDIKPGNIVMTDTGPVIVDLGIAKLSGMSRELTGTGLVLGTIGFVAPELHRGNDAAPTADVWSWGATIAFAATGRQLFGQGNPGSTIEAILSGNRNDSVIDELAGIDRNLAAAVWDATQRDPAARPPDGSHLLGILTA